MEESSKHIEKELELALQMKTKFCDKSGKETNPVETAQLIHKIGLIYRDRSFNKLSLIKSAGLFNAAIVRNPPNVADIKSDLAEVCQHILKLAKAENQNADLIEKSKQVKTCFIKLRKKVKKCLSKLKQTNNNKRAPSNEANFDKITAVLNLNETIADEYKSIMADLCQFCENVMGERPSEYTVAGMGSLARQEITPYSDFEHIIVLHDDENFESHIEYFKWYSVIFHVIVLNMQETIIPSLDIFSLNSKNSKLGNWFYDAITPRGISFDGMMPHACKFPLGRQTHTSDKQFTTELIKPVSKMLEYLSSEADLKNGYHLHRIREWCKKSSRQNIKSRHYSRFTTTNKTRLGQFFNTISLV